MPSISSARWEKLVPRLGDNQAQPKPFYLEVNASLTKAQVEAFHAAQVAAMLASDGAEDFTKSVKPMAEAMGQCVRLGAEPLVVDGAPIDSMEKYVALCFGMAGLFNLLEVTRAVKEYNELGGTFSHFSEWRSGGSFGTRDQSAGQDSATMGAR